MRTQRSDTVGMIGFFGSGGLSIDQVHKAIFELKNDDRDFPMGFNLIHSPNDPQLEMAVAELYVSQGVQLVSASAYLGMTLPLVYYRVKGIHQSEDGRIICPNRVIAKVSRIEVANKFFAPPPQKLLAQLVQIGKISSQEAQLAEHIPVNPSGLKPYFDPDLFLIKLTPLNPTLRANHAGLVSAIRSGGSRSGKGLPGSADWPLVVLRPGADPLKELADALWHEVTTKDVVGDAATFAAKLRAEPRRLHDTVGTALHGTPQTQRLVLVVDQFEEIFTQCPDQREPDRIVFGGMHGWYVAGKHRGTGRHRAACLKKLSAGRRCCVFGTRHFNLLQVRPVVGTRTRYDP